MRAERSGHRAAGGLPVRTAVWQYADVFRRRRDPGRPRHQLDLHRHRRQRPHRLAAMRRNTMIRPPRAHAPRRQRGMSLIELMLAMFVLAVGLAGGMILVSPAIASNNRNKLD